ncbi:Rrf2 family transcriptional regulator [Candidatus Sulfidibacterium hydrothermale]|uniref:RrF2 family transcriptional regulator n=1 Tax=Candidatus Sulfidibacterium hydrothermale TaxID=2875962 RepID=UPI001F0AE76A|nr:Rrf2 family transcriptional regulator [Candidatus Sulfidibacterium hydrothermale]UBM63212.1 Rrf2 family transcriptional regulator [Candidatus Sulfidibacterium hydrothermale]
MRLSKTAEYALRILSFMINSEMQVFSARYLAEQLHIPDKYLRRLMTDMAKKGFIKSIQGREGGYVFGKNANAIHLSEIIDAVEGMDKYTGCLLGFQDCSDENPCSLHEAYAPIREQMLNLLNTMTIADLKSKKIKKF